MLHIWRLASSVTYKHMLATTETPPYIVKYGLRLISRCLIQIKIPKTKLVLTPTSMTGKTVIRLRLSFLTFCLTSMSLSVVYRRRPSSVVCRPGVLGCTSSSWCGLCFRSLVRQMLELQPSSWLWGVPLIWLPSLLPGLGFSLHLFSTVFYVTYVSNASCGLFCCLDCLPTSQF